MFKLFLVRTSLLLLVATPTWSFNTGNELFNAMQTKSETLEVLRFVKGVASGAELAIELGKTGTIGSMSTDERDRALEICMPTGVTMGQTVDVVKKWLQNSPENRHMDAAFLVLIALRKGFPCRP